LVIGPQPHRPRLSAWRKIKQVIDLPCVVIGYRTGPGGLRDCSWQLSGMASWLSSAPSSWASRAAWRSCAAWRRGGGCVVECAHKARWVEPELFCVVRHHGWRPGGGWRDPVFVGLAEPA
jgi:hypothetical protein